MVLQEVKTKQGKKNGSNPNLTRIK